MVCALTMPSGTTMRPEAALLPLHSPQTAGNGFAVRQPLYCYTLVVGSLVHSRRELTRRQVYVQMGRPDHRTGARSSSQCKRIVQHHSESCGDPAIDHFFHQFQAPWLGIEGVPRPSTAAVSPWPRSAFFTKVPDPFVGKGRA